MKSKKYKAANVEEYHNKGDSDFGQGFSADDRFVAFGLLIFTSLREIII